MIVADNASEAIPPEQKLWAAVIVKALSDLRLAPAINRNKCRYDENRKKRESAYDFLFSPLPAFAEWRSQVFYMAGLNPDLVLDGIKPEIRGIQCRKRRNWKITT